MNAKWLFAMGLVLLILVAVAGCEQVLPGEALTEAEKAGLVEPSRHSPEAAARAAFEVWVQERGVPYRNESVRVTESDGTFAMVQVVAEFRASREAPWVEQEASLECRRVGDLWQCDSWMQFFGTAARRTREAQQAAAEAREAAAAATDVASRPLPTPVATRVRPKDGTVMVYVPAGEFPMGSTEQYDDEKPQHPVYLDGFWIDRTEVTNAQYRKFMEDGGYSNSAYWKEGVDPNDLGRTQPEYWDDEDYNAADQPVVGVTWYEAAAYAEWAGAQLPTEAQWEKACRGTDGRIWPWGNEWDRARANTEERGVGGPSPVGRYPTGASPCGALDMAGNVWEWVADWYDGYYYSGSPERNPTGPDSGEDRVVRGGSWFDHQDLARCAFRFRYFPNYSDLSVGFRLVSPVSP